MPAATTMQMEASPADQRPPRRRRCCCHRVDWGRVVLIALLVLVVGFVTGGICYLIAVSSVDPVYYVSIDAVSGLEPVKDLGGAPTLDPVFNLTIRLSSLRWMSSYKDCLSPGTALEVTYRGVLLASGPVGQFCVGGRQTKDEPVVAWGNGVRLQGFALDALAADARRGAEVFDVAVKIPDTAAHIHHHGNHHDSYYMVTLVSCRATRVGDDPVAALSTPCDVTSADIPPASYPNTGRTQPGGAS